MTKNQDVMNSNTSYKKSCKQCKLCKMFGGNAELHTTDCCNKKNSMSHLFDEYKKKHMDRAKKEVFCAIAKAFKKASFKSKKLIKDPTTTHWNQTLSWKRNDLVATIISKKSDGFVAKGKDLKIENEGEILQVICNSGASTSIVHKKYCSSIFKYRCKCTTWATAEGEFKTWHKARVKFQLPEFPTSKEISWSFHVDESNPNDDTL
eukprot:15366264-Ditylum_brightwellii.AAC.1